MHWNMDLAYGIPSLTALILAFAWVRHVARRERTRRRQRARQSKPPGVRSLSQRSEMRAAEDPSTVMESIQRTHSRPPTFPHEASTKRPAKR